jgi:ferredoxin
MTSPMVPAACAPRSFHRLLHLSAFRCGMHSTADPNGKDVHVTFIEPSGERHEVTGKEGENLLSLAHQNDVELEGACEGSVACSTCHCILPEEYYSQLEPPSDEENDMLDLAFGLTDT